MISPVGVILAGGKSRRMGRDKATLPLGESTFLQHTINDMRTVCTQIHVLAAPDQILPPLENVQIDADPVAHQGPAAALVHFARRHDADWLLVRAVDMPLADVSDFMQQAQKQEIIDGCMAAIDGFDQPLFALYRRSSLQDAMLSEKGSMFEMLQGLHITRLTFSGHQWINFNHSEQVLQHVG